MAFNNLQGTGFTEIREKIAKLSERSPNEYWRKLDRAMAYPSEFVNALGEAAYLAALIP